MIVQNLALKKVIKSHLRIFQCIDDNHGSTLIRDLGAGADDPMLELSLKKYQRSISRKLNSEQETTKIIRF